MLTLEAERLNMEAWRLTLEPWRAGRPVVKDLLHFYEEQDPHPDRHHSEKTDPDPHKT
jgi:hypothetical protein